MNSESIGPPPLGTVYYGFMPGMPVIKSDPKTKQILTVEFDKDGNEIEEPVEPKNNH